MAMNLLMKCKNLEETRSFYAKVLGFEVSDTAVDTCSVQKAGGTIVFSAGDNLGDTPNMTGTIYFFLPGVDEYYDSMRNNVEILWPLQDMMYGTREFGIKDCNGYHLAFAQNQEI